MTTLHYTYSLFHPLTGKFLGHETGRTAKEAIKRYLLSHPMMNEKAVRAERMVGSL